LNPPARQKGTDFPPYFIEFRLSVGRFVNAPRPRGAEWSKILELRDFGTMSGLIASRKPI
jgi:hypothetical protein